MNEDMVPVVGCEDILADPQTAKVLGGRLERGEITPDELRSIMRGEQNAPAGPIEVGIPWGTTEELRDGLYMLLKHWELRHPDTYVEYFGGQHGDPVGQGTADLLRAVDKAVKR